MADNKPNLNLDSLFLAALEIKSPQQRAAFLAQSCGGDASLLSEVEQLLRCHEQAGGLLDQPAPEIEAALLPSPADQERAAALEAGLAAAFPANAAVVIGDANHSVLKALGQTIDVPRVVLREADEGPDPVVRPKSDEMPQRDSDSRYQLQGEIARGGMGAILKGRDTDLGRDLAIKVLLDAHKDKPDVVQRFVEEAQIGGQLQHPGIAPVYELGRFADRRPFFSMKLVKGETLLKLLNVREAPTAERGRFLGIFEHVCQTMAYAHSRGVIHRDLKPANIMVGAFGEVQVMDWGLAKVLAAGGVADEKQSRHQQQDISIIQTMRSVGSALSDAVGSAGTHTEIGSVMGTPAYMPPEQALGEIDNLDERADVFGLGAILCEILTGKPPYVGPDSTAVFRQASRGKLNACMERLEACGADNELVQLAKDCLELEPQDRPRDAGVLAERVSGYLESVEIRLRETEVERAAEAARADAGAAQAAAERQRAEAESARAEAESARAQEERKRRRTSLALAASVLLLVGMGGGSWLYMAHLEAKRQTAEAEEQRKHALEMEKLAKQRDTQRLAAEKAEANALDAKSAADKDRTAALAAQAAAEAAQEQGRRLLYATDMQLAPMLWKDNDATLEQLRSRLDAHNPNKNQDLQGKEDLRGFEWYYYQHLVESGDAVFSGNDGSVADARLTSDGHLVTLTDRGQVRRWDLISREEREASRRNLAGGEGSQFQILSASGRLAALAVGKRVLVFDATSGKEIWQVDSSPNHRRLIFSPAGDRLVIVDDKIRWLDAASGRVLATVDQRFDRGTANLALSADGLTLVVAGHGQLGGEFSVLQLDAKSGTAVTLAENIKIGPTIAVVALSADGRRIAVGSKLVGSLYIFDIDKGRLLGRHNSAHPSSISALNFSADGTRLATADTQGTIKIWGDVEQLSAESDPLITLKGHTASIARLGFSSDGAQLVSAGADATARVWDVSNPGVTIQALTQSGYFPMAGFSRDGSLIAVAGEPSVRLWDAATGQLVRQLPAVEQGNATSVAFSPTDSRLLAVGYGGAPGVSHVSMWDIESGMELARFPGATDLPVLSTVEHAHTVGALAFSPDGKHLVAGFGTLHVYWELSQASPLKVWDVSARRLIRRLNGHTGFCSSLAFSADGTLLASGSRDGKAIVWSTETWKPTLTLINPDPQSLTYGQEGRGMVGGVAFSPDGTTLAMASLERHVHLWDVRTGGHLATLAGHSNAVHSVAFSPDGRTLASAGNDQTVRLWNTATGRELMQLDSGSIQLGRVWSLAFSPDGRQLLAGGDRAAFWSAAPNTWRAPDRMGRHLARLLASKADFQSSIRMFSENLRLHEALERLEATDPRVAAALAATRANWHASQRRWSDAAAEFQRLEQLSPNTSQSWLQAPGLLRVSQALFEQNESLGASKLLAAAARQLEMDGSRRANMLGVQFNETSPVRLVEVLTNTPASRAGLRAGDLILKVNGVELTEQNESQSAQLFAVEPGTTLQFTVQREGHDEPEQIELTKELIFVDDLLREQVGELRSNVERRLAEHPDDWSALEFRAELHALAARHQAQAADYTSAIEVLFRRPTEETAEDLARLYRRRGDAHLALRQWQLALDDYACVVSDEATDEFLPTNEASALANVLLEGVESPESNATDPWVRLAAAFRLKKNPQAIDDLVARRPLAAGNIGGLYADDQDWQRAVEIYTQGINADANDFELIARRARAYEELKNWEAAAADWSRATTEDPEAAAQLAEFATRLAYAGQRELAAKERQRARQLLEAAFQADEGNDLVAEQLAQVLLDMSEPEWTVLEPTEMESAGGATLTKLDDGSIFVSGPNPDQDTYRVTAVVPKSNLAAIRLEVIPDPRLPGGGGGRSLKVGNFVLSQFSLKSLSQDDVVQVPLKIADAFATYEENTWTIARAFDQATDTAWATFPKQTLRQSAVFVLAKAAAAGDRLSIELECRHPRVSEDKGCNIGRFRLSVLTDPAQIPIERHRLAAAQLTDLWVKLAAARATSGQVEEAIRQFDKILAGTVGLEERNAVIHQLQRFDEVLPALAQRHPDEPQLQLALARQLKLNGERALAAEEPAAAIAKLKQAQEIFDQLLREPRWQVLTPTELASESGTTLAVQPDGSILASGVNPEQETYTVAAQPGLTSITALRLETLPHPSLPKGGAGRDPNGSFFLNELTVNVSQPGDLPAPGSPPWKLQNAVASFHRTIGALQHPIQRAIDGDSKTRWDAWPEVYQRQEAVLELSPQPGDLTAATLKIQLHSDGGGALGRFRLAVTNEPEAVKRAAARMDLKQDELVELKIALAQAYGQQSLFAEAMAEFTKAFDLAADTAGKTRIIAEAAPLAGALENLAKRAEDDAAVQAALARHFAERGHVKFAAEAHTKARTLFERQLAVAPRNAALAGELADLLLAGRGPDWTVLKPSEVKAEGGTELSPQEDGSILASEEPKKNETYVITARLKPGKVTSLYLEALTHASLPRLGPGWGDSNFHLTQFRALLQKPGQDAVPLQFRLAGASHMRTVAEGAQPQDGPWAAMDGNQETVWDIWPQFGKPHWLVMRLTDSIDAAEGDQLIVHLDFQDQRWPRAKLGCFRLSVADDESLVDKFLLSEAVRSAEILGFDALAAAHLASGDPARAAEVLRPAPNTNDSQVRLLLRLMAQRSLGESAAARETAERLFESLKTELPPRSLQEFCFEIANEVGSVDRLQFNELLAETRVIHQELAPLTKEVGAKPAETAGFNSRGQYFARLGWWRQSANDYLQAVKLDPATHRPWGVAASALLMARDQEGYWQNCRAMLKQFHGTNDTSVADVVCKNSLLLPDTVDVAELPTQVVRAKAGESGVSDRYRSWFMACNALISYREGKPAEAIDWTSKMPSLAGQPGALALVVRAMSEEKLGRHEQAIKSLAEAEALIPVELRTLGTANYAGPIPVPAASIAHDWLVAEILRREAKELIHSIRDPTSDNGSPRQ